MTSLALKSEVLAILEQLSHDELRVFRFMGRRMIDIGHAKYGALDLSSMPRIWSKEMAQETADRRFYAECEEIAREDRRQERVQDFVDAFAPDAPQSPGAARARFIAAMDGES